MMTHQELWRRDLSTVPATERRVARYALQLFQSDKQLRSRLSDPEILAALWRLALPLLEPGAVARLLGPCVQDEPSQGAGDNEFSGCLQPDDNGMFPQEFPDDWEDAVRSRDQEEVRRLVHEFFRTLPRWALPHLIEADGEAPASTTVAILVQTLGLEKTEAILLDYLDQRELSEPLRILLRGTRNSGHPGLRINLARLAAMLGLQQAAVREALHPQAPLLAFGLAELSRHDRSDLEDLLSASELLSEVLTAAPLDTEVLLSQLIDPAPDAGWPLDAFGHLAEEADRLIKVLTQAAARDAIGINALFYGAPGTGKTELARALAGACGLRAYQVRSADDDGDGLRREGRLSAYLLAQRLLAKRRDALLIFDEVEDAFYSGGDQLALLIGRRGPGRQKGWMNRILEENPVPAIWITNTTGDMDPAFLRRFLLPVAFATPPRSVRFQMTQYHLGDCGLPPDLLEELADDHALAPAQLGVARRLIDLQPQTPAEQTVRAGIAAVRTLLHGAPQQRRRARATVFDAAYLNLAGDIAPGAIVQALDRQGHGNLCFYGPPGTGKTIFAETLAQALDRELVARQASDLISPYVGETEQNLARLFRETDPAQTILLLDEVDSFLGDRRQARHAWERTQVNELLQQMESYPGIFVAATNLMSGLDAAALRRFDFKLHFRALTRSQRLALFAREALGDECSLVSPALASHLAGLQGLTPGDFANVCRQRALLGESLSPEQFLLRLVAEVRLKGVEGVG